MTEQSRRATAIEKHGFTNRIVKIFLESNLSLILILLATVVGLAALGLTPREEDPQIVVPLADVYVNFPGHSAAEVEQLVTTPLEKILYQIDGVEYVYSMSRENQAIITVRYYVGEDRERSLVKLYKKLDENVDIVPPGVTGWVVKPVEIDDVPDRDADAVQRHGRRHDAAPRGRGSHAATGRRAERVAGLRRGRPAARRAGADGPGPDGGVSRFAAGTAAGHPRRPTCGRRPAISAANDQLIRVEAGEPFDDARQLRDLVVGVFDGAAGVPQGRRRRRGRPGGSRQLRPPRLGAGPRFHAPRVLPRHGAGRNRAAALTPLRLPSKHGSLATGRDDRDRQEEGLQRRLGGQRRAARGRRAARHDRARRHGTDRHPQLRPDGQREGQRTGRRPGGGRS